MPAVPGGAEHGIAAAREPGEDHAPGCGDKGAIGHIHPPGQGREPLRCRSRQPAGGGFLAGRRRLGVKNVVASVPAFENPAKIRDTFFMAHLLQKLAVQPEGIGSGRTTGVGPLARPDQRVVFKSLLQQGRETAPVQKRMGKGPDQLAGLRARPDQRQPETGRAGQVAAAFPIGAEEVFQRFGLCIRREVGPVDLLQRHAGPEAYPLSRP